MIGLLQATSVFVSTITITAIALDRRRLIVGSEQVKNFWKLLSIKAVNYSWYKQRWLSFNKRRAFALTSM
jgi:hypothetical protein